MKFKMLGTVVLWLLMDAVAFNTFLAITSHLMTMMSTLKYDPLLVNLWLCLMLTLLFLLAVML